MSPMTAPHELSVAELTAVLASGSVSAGEVARSSLDRSEALDDRFNAFVDTRPSAPSEAGAGRGPLAGIPVAIKDSFAVDGRAPTMGSNVHADWMTGTAEAVRRLRDAGAVLVGYTNLHEWAIGTTSIETATGPIRNPWNVDHVAGGSSGGSAAALAAGFVPAALGADMGGSIRIPAACCGVVGLKPTWGLVPTAGYVGEGIEIDHVGPMARTVADARTLLEVLAPGDYAAPDVTNLTVGVAESYFFDDLEAETAAVLESAIATLTSVVGRVVPVEIAALEGSRLAISLLALPAIAALLGDRLQERRDDFLPETAQVLMLGAQMSDDDRAGAVETHAAVATAWAEAFTEVDVVVTPTLPAPPALVTEKIVELPSGVGSADLAYIALNAPMNLGGVPCITLPCGETAEGWAVGASLTAARGNDAVALAAAEALEAALDGAFANRIAPLEP